MINPRIRLLLDAHFIRFSADCYQWALDSEDELRRMPEKKRRDVLAYHKKVTYWDKARELVNVEFKQYLREHALGEISDNDLERSWEILNRKRPSDPLGLAYVWFTTRISLYVPDRNCRTFHKLQPGMSREEVIDTLFRGFLKWAEDHDYLESLSHTALTPAFIDEVESIFHSTVDVMADNNPYVQQIFANETRANVGSVLDKASSEDQGQTSDYSDIRLKPAYQQ